MTGAVFPLTLVCAATGLCLSKSRRRSVWLALIALAIMAALASLLPFTEAWAPSIFVAFWISTIITAAMTYLDGGISTWGAILLGGNNGLWAGAVTTLVGLQLSSIVALLPLFLLMLPARWLAAQSFRVVANVGASWVIAISALAAGVALLPTPGYVADHME
ncbi:hypothetical protein [Blastomonas sp.]|uniref:hypothetical protein n=1 Tax=Blastomonas sp. TaxID=1909299 RepID=UPI003593557D